MEAELCQTAADRAQMCFLTELLQTAAVKGNEEASWLLKFLSENEDAIFDVDDEGHQRVEWASVAKLLSGDDAAPRAQYYRVLAMLQGRPHPDRTKLMRRAAETGFAPAMSQLGCALRNDEGRMWMQKAAEQGDADGLYWLGKWCLDAENGVLADRPKAFELLMASARAGNGDAMSELECFDDCLDLLTRSLWLARFMVASGQQVLHFHSVDEALSRLDDGCADEQNVQLLYIIGRELDGIEQYWDLPRCKRLNTQYERCVDVYLLVLYRARQAALQTTIALREIDSRMTRDVTEMIARRVYATRQEAYAWYRPSEADTNKKAKTTE